MSTKLLQKEDVRPGLVIEYLQNNQPVVAWIMEVQGVRVRALNINQREIKLAASRILPWAGPGYSPSLSREEVVSLLKEHNRKRLEEQEQLRIIEVWEMSQGEISQARVPWFAGLIWNDPGHDQTAALGRTMLQDRARFKFNPPCFEVYPEDVVEVRLEQERIAREKEKLVSIGRDLFKSLWETSKKQIPVPQIQDSETEEKLKNLLITRIKYPDDVHTQEVWTKVTTGLPQDPNLAFILARNWGIYSPHHNFLLEQADYVWGDSWTREHAEAISRIRNDFQDQLCEPEMQGFVSIDSETTRDIDDAFIVESTENGFSLTLALACPALLWQPGSALDKAVAHRASSLYLPEGTSNMLPDILAEDLFSLVENQPRPSLIFTFAIDKSGALKQFGLKYSWVMVDSNLTYEYIEKSLQAEQSENLKQALTLAKLLRRNRLDMGALILEQSDPQIRLENVNSGVRVVMENKEVCRRAQLIVSEFMILANSTLARWALDNDVPLYFRTQDITLPMDYSGVWSKPEDIYQVIRALGATLTETVPKPHRSIGAQCYAPITSPLRRYTDLINEMQVMSVLKEDSPCLSKAELDEMLPDINARTAAVSQVQKFRPRYWKLVYFKQNCKTETWQGIVVDNTGPFVVLNLPDQLMMVRAEHELFGGKTRLGQCFRLRLGRIDPLNNQISVLEAWEE